MIKDASKIIAVDLELTCWEGDPPPGESSEIIQIGWALLPTNGVAPIGKGAVIVRPVRSKISEFCTALTGITPKMAKGGMPFEHACKYVMRTVGGRSKPWAAWGDDRDCLIKQCAEMNAEMPFSEAYIDAQLTLTVLLGSQKPRMSLEIAMQTLGIEACGQVHRADNDAFDTAAVLLKAMNLFRSALTPKDGPCTPP